MLHSQFFKKELQLQFVFVPVSETVLISKIANSSLGSHGQVLSLQGSLKLSSCSSTELCFASPLMAKKNTTGEKIFQTSGKLSLWSIPKFDRK